MNNNNITIEDNKDLKAEIIEDNKDSETEIIIRIERLHLRKFGDNIDILYRPNHDYIDFVKANEDGFNRIKELLHMSRENFAQFLKTKKSFITKSKYSDISKSTKEEWFKGAWKTQTDNILKEINEENVIEEPLWANSLIE